MKYTKVLFVPDIHCPYQDEKALRALYNFMDWWKPQEVIILGDLVDFYSCSSFSKDPERALQLQNELDESVEVLRDLRSHAKKAPFTFLAGNHEARLKKYLWTHAKELSGLRELELSKLLKFDEFKIKYIENGIMHYKGIVVKHGNVVRKYSGYSARGEFEKNGLSGVSGHTHRLNYYRHTNEAGDFVWVEGGCLCKMDAEYMKGCQPNWQTSFVIGYFKENSNKFNLEIVPIINGKALYGGNEY